jgi:plastocyanin
MRRALVVGLAGLTLIAGACSSSKKTSTTATTAGGTSGAQVRDVKVDNKTDKFNGAFLAYFPNQVTVHPGDTVQFQSVYTGEPHTVTMGTLVEKGLAAAQGADPNGPPPPDFASLPTLLPQGPGDAHQNAAQPCFLATGAPPTDDQATPCAKTPQPAFNGTQTYYNSGFLPDGKTFSVKLADDIAPGSYRYYCNLHGPSMSGSIVVEGQGSPIPSKADVDKAGQAQLDELVTKLLPAYQDAKAGKAQISGNLAGYGSDAVESGLINEFIPPTIDTKVGQKVSWTFVGPHTITFNAPPDAAQPFLVGGDGAMHLNPKAFTPAGGPGAPEEPPSTGPPPTGPPTTTIVDGGSFDGTGFRSTGLFLSFPPQLTGYSLTFTKPGTFPYVCLIHPGMGGVVRVS